MIPILQTLLHYKYVALFILAASEGPVVSLLAGYLIRSNFLLFLPAFFILLLGDFIPDSFLYLLGYFADSIKVIEKYIFQSKKFQKHFPIVEGLWNDYPFRMMFFGKLAYGMAAIFLTSAGMAKISYKKFVSYTVPISAIQYSVLMGAGYAAGSFYSVISRYFGEAYFIATALAIVFAALYNLARRSQKEVLFLEEKEEKILEKRKEIIPASEKLRENKKNFSCVIPAYNEEQTISNTLQAAIGASGFLREIIVIDDCSADKTGETARKFPEVKLLTNEKNLGKSASIARGIAESSGEHIVMLDADLLGLKSENIVSLIEPVASGQADAAISIRENTPRWMKKIIGIDFMSGERVFPKSIVAARLEEMKKLKSFGLEVFLNKIIIGNRLRIRSVIMEKVYNNRKVKKNGFRSGLKGEILMWRDIFKTISLGEFISQGIRMRRLLVK